MSLLDAQNLAQNEKAEHVQLRRFFDFSLDLLAIFDQAGSFRRVNPAMERMLGYSQEELLGMHAMTLVHPDDRDATEEEMRKLERGEPISHFENRFVTRSGQFVWLSWTCFPVLEEGLRYAVARDVTAQKITEARLHDQQRALADLMRHPAIQQGHLEEAIRAITETAARSLEVARASVWFFSEDRSQLICMDLFEQTKGSHTSGEVLQISDYPLYLDAVTRERSLCTSDVMADPRTREFASGYFPKYGIRALLDVPVRIAGTVRGVLCHEHVGSERRWTPEEEAFAAALGDALSLACETHEHMRAQEALRQSEERLRYITDATTDALYDWNIVTGEFWWSDGLHTLSPVSTLVSPFGLEQWREYVHPEDTDRVWASLRQALAQNVAYWTEEYRFLRDRDTYATVRERGYIMRDAQGRAVRMIGAMEDISDWKRAEEERARSLARESAARAEVEAIRELNRLKTQFVNAVSHDLRVPLTSVMGYAEFLEDEIGGILTPQQTVFVEQIQKNALRLARLVDDLLDFARMEAGTLQLNWEVADLGNRIQEVVDSLRPQIDAAGLSLELDLPPEPVETCFDGPRIERVFFNLLSNAMKFTPPDGRIRVTLAPEGESIRAEVRDSGSGIAAEDLAKLFKPFSQLQGAREKGGTGLGLNIVKLLVEAHGGHVGVTSVLGEGSRFWVSLPVRECPVEALDEPFEA